MTDWADELARKCAEQFHSLDPLPAFPDAKTFLPGVWEATCLDEHWHQIAVIATALRTYAEEATRQIRRENEWYRAAHMLLASDEAFAYNDETSPFSVSAQMTEDGKAALALNMNDVFAWACADAEPFTYEDAPALLKIAVEEGWPGLVRWACEKRGTPPQNPVLENMERYDAKIRHLVEKEREACATVAASWGCNLGSATVDGVRVHREHQQTDDFCAHNIAAAIRARGEQA